MQYLSFETRAGKIFGIIINQFLIREIFGDFKSPFPIVLSLSGIPSGKREKGYQKKKHKKVLAAVYYIFQNIIVLCGIPFPKERQTLSDSLRCVIIHELRHWQQFQGRLCWISSLSALIECLPFLLCLAVSSVVFWFGLPLVLSTHLYLTIVLVVLWIIFTIYLVSIGLALGKYCQLTEFDARRYERKMKDDPRWKEAIQIIICPNQGLIKQWFLKQWLQKAKPPSKE